MSKTAHVYMFENGVQKHYTMDEYLALRGTDPYVRSLLFIPVDDCMYQASAEQFKAWKKEKNRADYIRRTQPQCELVPYDTTESSGDSPYAALPDERVDVAEAAVERSLKSDLQDALLSLTGAERELIRAIYYKGMTVREYAEYAGLPTMTVQNRKNRILQKLKNLMRSKK